MPQGAEEGTAAQPAPGLSAIPGGKVFISYYVWYIRSDPNFEPIRSDPRYTQLLKKWGLIT
jgi:hypothetical protein